MSTIQSHEKPETETESISSDGDHAVQRAPITVVPVPVLVDSIEIQCNSDIDDGSKVNTAIPNPISVDTGADLETSDPSLSVEISPFMIHKNMFSFYLFSLWDCLTDILVCITLSRNCKRDTFQESNQLHTYYILSILSYLSAVVGIINVGRQYRAAIMAYLSSENEPKSIWNDGFKYTAIKYVQQLHIAKHCTKEKKLRTFFVVGEDWLQFCVTHTLLLFFQDGNVLALLSWATSLLSIAFQLSRDIFSCIRGSCCCCQCTKDKCYDRKSKCMKTCYCLSIFIFGAPILFLVPLQLFVEYDSMNTFIGGTLYYRFEGNVHWIGADTPVVYNLSATIRTNPFGQDWEYDICRFCDDGVPTNLVITFRFVRLKQDGPYSGVVSFVAFDNSSSETFYYFDNRCTDLDSGVICSMSSEDLEAGHHSGRDLSTGWALDSPNSTVIYTNVSVWRLQYELVYYTTC
eukprot:68248_1